MEQDQQRIPPARRARRLLRRTLRWLVLFPLILVALVIGLLYLPPVQGLLGSKVTAFLQGKIGTPVRLDRLSIGFPARVELDGLLLLEASGDTLLYAREIRSSIGLFALMNGGVEIGATELSGVRARIIQAADSTFNFDHILKAFSSGETAVVADTSSAPMAVSASSLALKDVHFDLDLVPSHLALTLRLASMDIAMEDMDAVGTRFHAGVIALADARLELTTASGPKEPDSYPHLGQPFAGLDISARELHLDNIAFRLHDATSGDSLALDLASGDVVVDSIALGRQRVHIRSIDLDSIGFAMFVGDTSAPLDTAVTGTPAWLDQHDGFRYWTRDFDLQVQEMSITNGAFAMHQGAVKDPRSVFDGEHVVFADIHLDADDVLLNNQVLRMTAKEITADAPDGTRLRAAWALNATPAMVAISDGAFAMNDASVRLSASAAIGDPSNGYRAPELVPLRARINASIDQATIARMLHDLGIADPISRSTNEQWTSELALSGTLRDIDTLGVDVAGDQGSAVHLIGSMRDIAAWPRSSFVLDLREFTLGAGLRDVALAYVPADVPFPQRFSASARATGAEGTIDLDLDVRSDLGDVRGTLSAVGLRDSTVDGIGADLELAHIAIARFIGDTAVSTLSAHVTASGEALNTSMRSGSVHVVPSRLVYHGQDFGGAEINATVRGDSIHADISTHASAMDLRLISEAKWPAGSDTLSGSIDLRVDRLGLKEFGWYAHPLDIQGQWKGTAAFSADGFLAVQLKGDSVSLSNTDHAFDIEEFDVKARVAQDSTFLDLNSNALRIAYSTNVAVDSLLPRARERALSFFATDTAHAHVAGERMNLEVALPRTEWLTDIVLPELEAIELKEFTGHYDGDADELRLSVDLPVLRYEQIEVRALTLNAEARGNALDGTLQVDSAQYGSFKVKDLSLTAASAPGALRTEMRIGASDGRPEFLIPLEFRRTGQEITMHVQEGLVLDTLPWNADPKNILRFTEAGLVAEHFKLSSGAQGLALTTGEGSTTVELDHFDIGAVVNVVSTTDSTAVMDGELTGTVVLPLTEAGHLRADVRMDGMAITGQPLGDLAVKASGSSVDGYEGTARFENGQNAMDARVHYRKGEGPPDVQAHADLRLEDVSFLSPFVVEWLYQLSGGLTGTLDWSSRSGKNDAKGDVTFKNTVVGVVATGARYELRDEHVLADGTGVRFDDFTVLDSLGTAFVLDGSVRKNDDADMSFDLRLRTDSFRLMHRARAASAAFYGDLFTSADVRITGTGKAPVVKGDLGILPGTDLSIVLPGSKVELVRSEGIVEFTTDLAGLDTAHVKTTEERMRDSLRAQLPDIDMDLHLRIEPRAAFAVVLDPTAGDQATFKGKGDLRFRYKPDGEMDLRGPFTVSEGGYTLEFYGLVKKRFDLIAGSEVVWQGDPMSAKMDVRARYVSKSSAYPLVAKTNATMSDAQRNRLSTLLPFEVIIHIGGAMHEPDITFGLDLPREYRNSYSQVDAELDRLAEESQEETRNKQVFGLLVFNSFIQDEGSGSTSGNELATNAARNSVNGILTDQLNKRTGQLVKGVDVQLGVSTVDQTDNATTYQRTSLDYKVSKSFVNDRLSFQVGGSVGVNEKATNSREVSNTRNAQYSILYDLTLDGRYQVRGFYENAFDLYDGEITDSGVALMLTREFEENEKARERMREAERLRQMEELKRKKERDRSGDEETPITPAKP